MGESTWDQVEQLKSGLADASDEVADVQYDLLADEPLTGDLSKLDDGLRELLRSAPDLAVRVVVVSDGREARLVYESGLVDPTLLARVAERLTQTSPAPDVAERPFLIRLGEAAAPAVTGGLVHTLGTFAERLFEGSALFAVSGEAGALTLRLPKFPSRGVAPPLTTHVVMGPRDGFVEDVSTNLALMRRRLRTHRLWVDRLTIGKLSRTSVYVVHVHGVADDHLVKEVETRLRGIAIDGVLESNYLSELIRDAPWSPFPTVLRTERPDSVAASLLEGRVAIVTDGSPFVLIVPCTLTTLFSAAEDYFQSWQITSILRSVRLAATTLGVFLPGLYVAITTFHQEFLPTPLLISVSASRETVPFPTLVEVLLMLVLFEIIREAGVRVPSGVGSALTIGGTLVVGDAAVRAGVISAPIVIVVGAVIIAFFVIPNYDAVQAFRFTLYPLLLAGGFLGIYGILFVFLALALHLASLRSFGAAYLSPFAPMRLSDLKDSLIRAPWWAMKRRPTSTFSPAQYRQRTPRATARADSIRPRPAGRL